MEFLSWMRREQISPVLSWDPKWAVHLEGLNLKTRRHPTPPQGLAHLMFSLVPIEAASDFGSNGKPDSGDPGEGTEHEATWRMDAP